MPINNEKEQIKKPHVVILGAGASKAACEFGDINNKKLPLMNDLIVTIGLDSDFKKWKIDPNQNFELIYGQLYKKRDYEKIEKIESKIYEYFSNLKLPDKPTIYDHLVLSLTDADIIATFNWDPLLTQAYIRNSNTGLKLPQIYSLHGNVCLGYCEDHIRKGPPEDYCPECRKKFKPTPILFPIKEKNYSENSLIRNEWTGIKHGLKHGFMITIFGYSAPINDKNAISIMKDAWGKTSDRIMEQTEFITIESSDHVYNHWGKFIHGSHFEVHDNFYESIIAKHPRRTGEAYHERFLMANFLEPNPIPKDYDFDKLWEWLKYSNDVKMY